MSCSQGLGISFLRHIERCLCLLYVIDLSDSDPVDQLNTLKFELEQYEQGLSRRPHAILANKIDHERAQPNLEGFLHHIKTHEHVPVFPISSKVGTNLRNVLDYIKVMYDQNAKKDPRENSQWNKWPKFKWACIYVKDLLGLIDIVLYVGSDIINKLWAGLVESEKGKEQQEL